MARTRTVLGAVNASTVFVGFDGVVFSVLPNLGTVIGITPFVVGLVLSAIASDGVPASRDRSSWVVTPQERTILFCCPL